MADGATADGVASALASVRLRVDPEREAELAARTPAVGEPRPLSVTDLVNPRRAVFRRLKGPAPMPLDRQARLEQGRSWHRRLGLAVAEDGRLEVRVQREGLTARIDLLTELPVEIKSGSGAPEDRPDQLEQLAIYCALTGHRSGRLVHLVERDPDPPSVVATDLEFADLAEVEARARRRAEAIRSAIARGEPAALGRCRWFDRGCEYRLARLCSCRGDEASEPSILPEPPRARRPRPEIAERWEAALRAAPPEEPRPVERYRELLYPRRAFFDRRERRPAAAAPARPPSAPLDAYERAMAALERGPVGELYRLPSRLGAPGEEVLGWRAAPCAVRSSRVRSRLTAEEIVARFPQYVLDLGLRCAATGRDHGTLVVGHEHAPAGGAVLQVFDLELTEGVGPFAAWYDRRVEALERAEQLGRPDELPACPAWMATDCPYRDACGCAAGPGRSQR